MIKYKKIYLDFFNYCEQDFIPCEICSEEAVDPHHIIYKSQGGKDEIGNLIGVCRKHHDNAHDKILSAEELFIIHNHFIENYERNNN